MAKNGIMKFDFGLRAASEVALNLGCQLHFLFLRREHSVRRRLFSSSGGGFATDGDVVGDEAQTRGRIRCHRQ